MGKAVEKPEYDYSDYKPEEEVSDNAATVLAQLAQEQVAAEALIASLEEQLTSAKAALNEVKERRIPAVMDELDLERFTTRDGVDIKISEQIRGSIPKAKEAEAFNWLESNDNANLIKRTFTIQFGKDEDKWADKFERDLARRKKPLAVKREKKVSPQTLQAFVMGRLAEGHDFPMELFGVYRQRFAKVTVKS